MGLNYYASSSPAMVLTPSQEHRSFPFGSNYLDHQANASPVTIPPAHSQQNATMMDLPSPTPTSTIDAAAAVQSANRRLIRPRFPRPPSINYLAKTESLTSGRKRSFADAVEDVTEPDADGSQIAPPKTPSPLKARGEPVYGPGMTLCYPDDDSFAIAAESQTGTWAEDKIDRAETEPMGIASRPLIASRKSQRRTAPDSISVQLPDSFSSATNGSAPANSPSPTTLDPPIDALTLALGISWKRIAPSLAPAAKGWEKYVANHYQDIVDPTILLHSEAHRAYLVRSISSTSDTQECWWVFQEDLSLCRLVGFCEADAISGLQKNEMMGPAVEASKESQRTGQNDLKSPCALQNASTTTWAAQNVSVLDVDSHGDIEMNM